MGPSTGWGRAGKFFPGPAAFGGFAVAQKYQVHTNALFYKAKF